VRCSNAFYGFEYEHLDGKVEKASNFRSEWTRYLPQNARTCGGGL